MVAMKNFKWKGVWFSADAQKVGEELEAIERDGNVSPEHIVEYAERHPESELHKCFEWDNDEASRKYRLRQANQIICSITLEITEEPKNETRVYFRVKDKKTDKKVFKTIKEVSKDDELYEQVINKAKADFIRCKEKYETLIDNRELKEIIFEIYKNM